MAEYHLSAGREGLVIMPSGVARQWTLRESVKFTDDDMVFKRGGEHPNNCFARLQCHQKARAKQLHKHDYYTVFIKEAIHSGEVYLFAIHLTEMDSEHD